MQNGTRVTFFCLSLFSFFKKDTKDYIIFALKRKHKKMYELVFSGWNGKNVKILHDYRTYPIILGNWLQ